MTATKFSKLVLVFLLLVSAFNASCSLMKNSDNGLVDKIHTVIEGTKTACNFIPTVASIGAILGIPGAPAAAALSTQICIEVAKLPALEAGDATRESSVFIEGVEIQGVLY